MSQANVVIVGSTNMDMVVNTDRIPVPGETILASNFFMNPGGKGANQAVAVARLGGRITFVTKIGNDVFGHQSIQLFDDEGIDTKYILSDSELPSGVALITVDKHGENCIVVSPGANGSLRPSDFTEAILTEIAGAEILLMQLEIPVETVRYLADYAAAKGVKVILNPAPMSEVSSDLLNELYAITPNKTEAELLSGITIKDIDTAKEAAKKIYEKGVENVIITLGSEGALIFQAGEFSLVSAEKVKAIDSTAAGDVFNGALVVSLSQGRTLIEATRFACQAAAISVTRTGAQSSIPYRNEIIIQHMSAGTRL
ncbi:MAG: ribokinase [Chitinophagaceae bacterium]